MFNLGNIYLVKGTLQQLSYELNLIENVEKEFIVDPNWSSISENIIDTNPFKPPTIYIIYPNNTVIPTNLEIKDKYSLIVLVSLVDGNDNVIYNKLFKSCHKPYYAVNLFDKTSYIDSNKLNNISTHYKEFLNKNPKLINQPDEVLANISGLDVESKIIDYIYTGNLTYWNRHNRYNFYKYLLNPYNSKSNYLAKDKPPYGYPISLWLIFINFCNTLSLQYNLHPEVLLKLFAAWVYISTECYKSKQNKLLNKFSTKKGTFYSFQLEENSVNLLNQLIIKELKVK